MVDEYYKENYRLNNKEPHYKPEWTQTLWCRVSSSGSTNDTVGLMLNYDIIFI